MYVRHKIIIAGAGGIGRAAALILAEQADLDAEIFIGDANLGVAEEVAEWVKQGSSSFPQIIAFELNTRILSKEVENIFANGDIILDCLPGSEAPTLANWALKYTLHYVNLTEYVEESNIIIEATKNASTGFVLQAGLAPGYVNILAHQLYNEFVEEYGTEKVENVSMKVGALSKMALQPHFYGFTWSPIGVATEYVKDAIVIKNGVKTKVPALSDTTQLIIDGILYEDDYTSGGAADMPDYFLGKTNSLDYKTLRYPGHYAWVKKQLEDIPQVDNKPDVLLKKMLQAIPQLDEDQILIYVGILGKDKNNHLRLKEKSLKIQPMKVGNYWLKAIQICTAAPMLECARILLTNRWSGPILQSNIDPQEFLNGPFVQMVFNSSKLEEISH